MRHNPDYLTWFKDLDARLAKSRGVHSLISSNVSEPLDMLERLIQDNADELRDLQKHNNDWGHPVLKERIAARYGVGSGNVLLTNGCTNATYLSIISHVKPGDTVICESPAYQPMWQTAEMPGARIKWLRRRPPGYGVDPEELAHLTDRNTSLVILTNLHNPGGAHLIKQELTELARTVRRRNKKTRILVDEVFRDFISDRPACTVDPIFISTGSLSKVYGLSHLECGWIMADEATIGRIWPFFVMSDGNGSRYLESLSAVVFAQLDKYLDRARELVDRNRQALCRAMEPLLLEGLLEGRVPEHGCIWFPSLRGVRDAGPFCDFAAEHYKVYIVPGKYFNDRSRFRVGFGGDAEGFSSAVRNLSEAVASYLRRK